MAVSFTDSVKPHLAVLRFDYNRAARFLLGTRRTYLEHMAIETACVSDHENVLIA